MHLETPALMAADTAGPFRGLRLTAPVSKVDTRIRRVADGHLVIADVALADVIDLLLVLARRLGPYVDDLADSLADIVVDLDAEAIGVDDLDHTNVAFWCELYVERTPCRPAR